MSNNGSRSWILIAILAVSAAGVVVWLFFPQIIKQFAAGIVAFFAFLLGLIFRRKKS